MKVCEMHITRLRRGTTYQIVDKEECVICNCKINLGRGKKIGEL